MSTPTFFPSSTGRIWVNIDGRFLAVQDGDLAEIRRQVEVSESVQIQGLPLTADQTAAILEYFA